MEQCVGTFVDYITNNSEKWLESPRKSFFGGRSKIAQKFRISFRPSKNKIIFEFESGTKLGIELWRVEETLQFLKEKNSVVEIGARVSENYSNGSLEGHLKNIAKRKFERSTDTKTAPHIVDLLVLADIAELAYTTSPKNRTVQGVRFKR